MKHNNNINNNNKTPEGKSKSYKKNTSTQCCLWPLPQSTSQSAADQKPSKNNKSNNAKQCEHLFVVVAAVVVVVWGEVGAQGSMQKVIGSTKSKTRALAEAATSAEVEAAGARWRNATSSMQPALPQLVFLRLFLLGYFCLFHWRYPPSHSLLRSFCRVDLGLCAFVGLPV